MSIKLLPLKALPNQTTGFCTLRKSQRSNLQRTPWDRQDPHDPSFLRTFFKNTFELVGGLTVWLASEQATFMNGRYMSVNWSVDELVERTDETVSNGLLSIRLQGKFGHF